MRTPARWLTLFMMGLTAFMTCQGCSDDSNHGHRGPDDKLGLPGEPSDWVCPSSLTTATQAEINTWCENNPDRGESLPDFLQDPYPLTDLTQKNAYDIALSEFIIEKFVDTNNDLGWISDSEWRLTGPYVGEIGSGDNYGTHTAIKIHYSPEIVDWLCNNREGPIPDGSAIIKMMHSIDEDLGIELDDEGCMVITEQDVEPDSWTVMVKQNNRSFDGWYWGFHPSGMGTDPDFIFTMGNPPVFGSSAITSLSFYENGFPPTAPDPDWYPTGMTSIAPPQHSFGSPCMACHATAASESTFSSLDNILGMSIRYKLFGDNITGIKIPEYLLDALLPTPIYPSFVGTSTLDELEEETETMFTSPLADPDEDFLVFYDQLGQVGFLEAWSDRMPARTYSHVPSAQQGPPQYITANQCWWCHDAQFLLASEAYMPLAVKGADSFEIVDLSPYAEWSSSPMGMAGRDPIFFSQLQSETNNLSGLKTCIETTCLHCHGVMGQRQLAMDTEGESTEGCEELFAVKPPPGVPLGKPFTLEMLKQWPNATDNEFQTYGALARDGISCSVCHHISETDLGEEQTYTGNFVTGPADELYGAYEQVNAIPMQQMMGITPQVADQSSRSELCGSCHTILLPVMTNQGETIGHSYEQTTYLEWTNSDYRTGGPLETNCQNCHMPKDYRGGHLSLKIANIESNEFPPTTNRIPDDVNTLTKRDPFHRHTLSRLNIFLNQMSQQFPLILGIDQLNFIAHQSNTPPQVTTQKSMIYAAQNKTATVKIKEFNKSEAGELVATIEVTNLTGHYLPSGVGFRRMFLEFLVRDAEGNTLWASGRTNNLGAIVLGTTDVVLPSEQPLKFPDDPFQPHYEEIAGQDQVQIYQELVEDSEGNLTTSFLRRVTEVKDNRIRPKGYDPAYFSRQTSEYIQALAVTPGRAGLDPYYTNPNLTGSDVITYRVPLEDLSVREVHDVKVTLYYQSIPPFYLQERFRDANVGTAEQSEIKRLYYATSYLNVDGVEDDDGTKVLTDWKFLIASDTCEF